MPALLLLLLALAVSTLAAYVALDLARRVRVLRSRASAFWLVGAAVALAIGAWSCQIIAVAAEPLRFPLGYHPGGSLAVLGVAVLGALAGLATVSGRVATPLRVALSALALGLGLVGSHAIALLPLGLQPGVEWNPWGLLAALAGGAGGCMLALGAFFRGGDRTQPATLPWQLTAALVLGLTLLASEQLVLGAAGLNTQVASAHADKLATSTLTLLASVGSTALLLVGLLLSVLEARLTRSLRVAEHELQRRSFRDGLTRLPNRLMFEGLLAQAVQEAARSRKRLALLFVNLDGFKPVNVSLGHHIGDLMLREIAGRLKRFARAEDHVAHLGGDEFLLLVGGNPSAEDAAIFADRLQAAVVEPCPLQGREAVVTTSIGIVLFPEHGGAADLIAHAEAAMRSVKSSGGASYAFFESRMVSGARDQLDLLRDLRRALADGQLQLLYQPKIHAPSGEITGAEALDHAHRVRGVLHRHRLGD
ncbi:MAG: diguanylate cyclase, partial [Pseudomonadota bacterium]|nr:diguanylate cyclase [Pseudomonadota bacterium]